MLTWLHSLVPSAWMQAKVRADCACRLAKYACHLPALGNGSAWWLGAQVAPAGVVDFHDQPRQTRPLRVVVDTREFRLVPAFVERVQLGVLEKQRSKRDARGPSEGWCLRGLGLGLLAGHPLLRLAAGGKALARGAPIGKPHLAVPAIAARDTEGLHSAPPSWRWPAYRAGRAGEEEPGDIMTSPLHAVGTWREAIACLKATARLRDEPRARTPSPAAMWALRDTSDLRPAGCDRVVTDKVTDNRRFRGCERKKGLTACAVRP